MQPDEIDQRTIDYIKAHLAMRWPVDLLVRDLRLPFHVIEELTKGV